MALKGLSLPVRVGPGGRSVVSDGDEHAAKILQVALADCDNNNAFQQDEGLQSGSEVFQTQSSRQQARLQRRLFSVFADFERDALYRLDRASVTFEVDSVNQDLILSFDYINLESDIRQTFTQRFQGGR